MITVFFQSKLYLIGGVGRYRKQLNSIDIYDMHSREFYLYFLYIFNTFYTFYYVTKYTIQ